MHRLYANTMCVLSHSVVSESLQSPGLQTARLLCPWNFPGKNTTVGCHFLLQGIFLTQGLDLCLLSLLHRQVDSLLLSHLGSYSKYISYGPQIIEQGDLCSLSGSSVHEIFQARILEWVAISFPRGSSWPRDWTRISCLAGRFFLLLSHQGSPGKYHAILCKWTEYAWIFVSVCVCERERETHTHTHTHSPGGYQGTVHIYHFTVFIPHLGNQHMRQLGHSTLLSRQVFFWGGRQTSNAVTS